VKGNTQAVPSRVLQGLGTLWLSWRPPVPGNLRGLAEARTNMEERTIMEFMLSFDDPVLNRQRRSQN